MSIAGQANVCNLRISPILRTDVPIQKRLWDEWYSLRQKYSFAMAAD